MCILSNIKKVLGKIKNKILRQRKKPLDILVHKSVLKPLYVHLCSSGTKLNSVQHNYTSVRAWIEHHSRSIKFKLILSYHFARATSAPPVKLHALHFFLLNFLNFKCYLLTYQFSCIYYILQFLLIPMNIILHYIYLLQDFFSLYYNSCI